MKKKLGWTHLFVFVFALLSRSIDCSAQDPEQINAWSVIIGTPLADFPNDVRQIKGNDYIIAGRSEPGGAFLIELDATGNIVWNKHYSTFDILTIHKTKDLGFLAATGQSVLKLDSAGIPQWHKSYRDIDSYPDSISDAVQTPDLGYIAVGSAIKTGTKGSTTGLWIAKLSAEGKVQWQKLYSSCMDDQQGQHIELTKDGGYLVGGFSRCTESGLGLDQGLIVKLNSSGRIEWQKQLSIAGSSGASFEFESIPKGLIVTGHGMLSNHSTTFLVKLDLAGNVVWQKAYRIRSKGPLHRTADSGYVFLAGNSRHKDIIKLNSQGNIQWSKSYDFRTVYRLRNIRRTNDDGYVIVGDSVEQGSLDAGDFGIMKLDAAGEIHNNECVTVSDRSDILSLDPSVTISNGPALKRIPFHSKATAEDLSFDNRAALTKECL